jgi:hypothetical protein
MTKNTEQHMNGTPVELKITTDNDKTTAVENTSEPTATTASIEPSPVPETDRGAQFVQDFVARTLAFAQHAGIDVVQASDPAHPQHDIYQQLIGAALAMAESPT